MNIFTYGQRMNFLLQWECKLCPTKSSTFRNLRWHFINEHLDLNTDDQHICRNCNQLFEDFSEYFNHCVLKHFIQEYDCKCCGETFSTENEAIEHSINANHQKEDFDLYWINNPDSY